MTLRSTVCKRDVSTESSENNTCEPYGVGGTRVGGQVGYWVSCCFPFCRFSFFGGGGCNV